MKRNGRFEQRIRVLEARLSSEATILYLPEGRVLRICSRDDYVRRLFAGAFHAADVPPALAADLELIRSAVTIREPDGNRLDLLRAVLNSPSLGVHSQQDGPDAPGTTNVTSSGLPSRTDLPATQFGDASR